MKKYSLLITALYLTSSSLIKGQNIYCLCKDSSSFKLYTNAELKQHVDNNCDGTRIVMDETGHIILETGMLKGRKHGQYHKFYNNHTPEIFGQYAQNKKDGIWFFWDDKGKLIKSEKWKKDKLVETKTFI